MNASFWHGKRVFVTGHTGFKGSWLSLWLQQLGAEVIGYGLNPPTNPSLFEVANIGSGMTSILADIRDGITLTRSMCNSKPDIVIHMAAQPLVLRSYLDPVETFSTNVMGTVNLFEAIRMTPTVRAVINVTTDKCYENKEWVYGYRENETIGGFDPYSSSKGCSELVTSAYRNSYFNSEKYFHHKVAIASARAGNVIGGGDWAESRLIPDILSSIQSGTVLHIRHPESTRPWQHVLEPLSGYLILAEKLFTEGSFFSQPFNFGPNDADVKNVKWIVEFIMRGLGNSSKWQVKYGEHPHEASYLKLDCSKARALLGWFPKWELEIALNSIINWQKFYYSTKSPFDMRSICIEQINQYSNFNLS